MKRTGLIILILVILGVGAWYLQDYLLSHKAISNNVASDTSISLPVAEKKPVVDELKVEALRIASAPLRPAKDVSAETVALAREKIKSSVVLIKEDYNHDLPWLDLGAYRKLAGDYDGAISAWKFLIKIRPNDFVAKHNLGELYGYVLKNYSESEKYFLQSIKSNPKNIPAYISLSEIYAVPSFGRLDQIEKILLRGLENNPKDANLEARLSSYRASQ